MSTTVKTYVLQPQLDAPAQSQIRFPLWLKCLYNIAQMELTTLDPLGAVYLVALDAAAEVQTTRSLSTNHKVYCFDLMRVILDHAIRSNVVSRHS